jgi:hypothetical protein
MSKRAGQQSDRETQLKALLQEALKRHEITADELGLVSLDEVKRAINAVDNAFGSQPGDERLLKNLLPRHGFEAVTIGGALCGDCVSVRSAESHSVAFRLPFPLMCAKLALMGHSQAEGSGSHG